MGALTASKARTRLGRLIEEACSSHEPVVISSRKGRAVLVSEADWNAMRETVYLLSVPGLRRAICRGLKTPAKRCSREPGW